MTKAVSFRDVRHVLAHFGDDVKNEMEMLPHEMDEKIKPILFELGIDIRFPINVEAMLHRDMNDKAGIGFRYVGLMRRDRQWLQSKACSVMERISAASARDPALAREMCNLLGNHIDFSDLADYASNTIHPSMLSETWLEDAAKIKQLQEIALLVRGEPEYV